jgi:uncharacterized membrane protein YuzA (DUF378 family)
VGIGVRERDIEPELNEKQRNTMEATILYVILSIAVLYYILSMYDDTEKGGHFLD